jgi:hypothetical protein
MTRVKSSSHVLVEQLTGRVRELEADLAIVRHELLRAQERVDVAQKSARDAWAFAKVILQKQPEPRL